MQRRICEKCGKDFWWTSEGELPAGRFWVGFGIYLVSCIVAFSVFGIILGAVILLGGMILLPYVFPPKLKERPVYQRCPSCGSQGIDPETPFGKELKLRWKDARDELARNATSYLSQHGADRYFTVRCIDEGGDVNAANSQGRTALMHQVRTHRDLGATKALLDVGALVNVADNDGRTPLSFAVDSDAKLSIVKLLLRHGADVNLADAKGQTPLMWAMREGKCSAKLLHLLLRANAKLDAEDHTGTTALEIALDNGDSTAVKILMEAGARVKTRHEVSESEITARG
jgi:hypothetical protein